MDLRPFGYAFFSSAGIMVATDRKDVPVPAQYVIGAGDEVRILMWGRVNAQHNLVVDRNGNITIPQVGPLHIAGLTFEQMADYLIKRSEQIVADIDITMGTLESIPIFVLVVEEAGGIYGGFFCHHHRCSSDRGRAFGDRLHAECAAPPEGQGPHYFRPL